MCALFNPEILQAGAVKRLSVRSALTVQGHGIDTVFVIVQYLHCAYV